ncbi:hypothetical protein KGF54_001732 [Candida jiufengensis]|uniref:uncharacterized protein n=1 Tax=Candida jiufengensis TaxID=497108 RepID=UPI002224BD22|nr:uncharacterized protein KGF54_001732 [Candida jiufengensis]KAI5955171.1 hypothetical protein KGF54_001732 [Candida jiufengensis]
MSNLRHLMNYDDDTTTSNNNIHQSQSHLKSNHISINNLINSSNNNNDSYSNTLSYNNNQILNNNNNNNNNHQPKTELPNHHQNNLSYNHQEYQNQDTTQEEQEQEEEPEQSESTSTNENISTTITQDQLLTSFEKIKTHFPAARIKKIMQSDEEIGKVAQATPVVVGRALEIFMANLVESSILQAKKQGVKRITASHIKLAIEKNEQFDFLVEIVDKYPSMNN